MVSATGNVRGAVVSRAPTIYNVISPATPNTEFSQALSLNTKQFIIRTRGNGTLKIAFNNGESGTNYVTLQKHAVLSQGDLDLTGITLYMQCDKISETIEILEWT